MDDRLVAAVAARIELDLRIGAAFTRLQTLQLQTLKGPLEDRTISYGKSSQKFLLSILSDINGIQDHVNSRPSVS